MFCETLRVPGLPGSEDVTDGSVDYYGMDWENVINGATEEDMQKCRSTPCGQGTRCPDNTPVQSDSDEYEITQE